MSQLQSPPQSRCGIIKNCKLYCGKLRNPEELEICPSCDLELCTKCYSKHQEKEHQCEEPTCEKQSNKYYHIVKQTIVDGYPVGEVIRLCEDCYLFY